MTAPRSKTGKTGSRNPANRKPTSAAAWKKTSLAPPVELPSGHFMRLKKVGMQVLMQVGIMPNSLMQVAGKAVGKGTGKPQELSEEDLAAIASDPKKIEEIALFMDRMVIFVAQEPEVQPAPEDDEARQEDVLYIDEIDDEDKEFILQVVTGGTTDLESFREQHRASMDAIRGRQDLELPSE